MMQDSEARAQSTSYALYVKVWLALLALTALTVAMAEFRLGAWSVLAVIFVAATKSSLVGSYFMHLKHEPPVLRRVAFAAVTALAVFIALTFTDVAFR